VTAADIAAANGVLTNLEREQQATVVERYYIGKWGGGGFDPAIYEQLAKQVFKAQLRIAPRDVVLPHTLPLTRPIISRVPELALNAAD
jgi:hypothetical protein